MPDVVFVFGFVAALLPLVLPLSIVADRDVRVLFPKEVRILALAGGLGVAMVVVLAVAWPGALLALGGLCALAAALTLWRWHPDHGKGRGLPPGSLSMIASLKGIAQFDRLSTLAALHGPIFKMGQPSANAICVVGLERGRRLFREAADKLGPSPLAFTDKVMGGFLRYMDDPTHDIYGPAFRRAMPRAMVEGLAPMMRAAARREFETWPQTTVNPTSALEAVSHTALLRILLGLERGSDLHRRFDLHYRSMAATSIRHSLGKQAERDLEALRHLIQTEILAAAPEDCVLAALSKSADQPDGVSVDNLVFMLRIASNNVAGLLHWIVVELARNPDWQTKLAETPELGADFVLETLRLHQSEYLYRKALADIDFEGYRIPKGWRVRICVAESHRDEALFPDPTQFLARDMSIAPAGVFSPFGFDRHACNGAGMTLIIAQAVIAELVALPAFSAREVTPLVRDFRHWSHWRPNPNMILQIGPQDG